MSSLRQMPTSVRDLATHALLQQLQLAREPAAVHLFFTLLQHSLGLRLPQTSTWGPTSPILSPQDHGTVNESSIQNVLQQPWLMSSYLTTGSDKVVLWDLMFTQLLNSVLSLRQGAESDAASAKTVKALCQPYIIR